VRQVLMALALDDVVLRVVLHYRALLEATVGAVTVLRKEEEEDVMMTMMN
jgi:hypothetical protein